MPRFIYTAKSSPHKTIQGDIEAESEQEAISKITQMGYFPVSVSPVEFSSDKEAIFGFRNVSRKDIVLFTRQIATLIDSGVNIVNALNIISHQATNKYFKSILSEVTARIKDGKSFSDSLTVFPHLFSQLYSSMVRTGESSGNLNETLKRLADFLEKEEEFKNSLRSALIYPFFIFVVGVLTVSVLLVFVIPRLVTMFLDMGQVLPLPTRILIGSAHFFQSYWWIILATIFLLAFFLKRMYRSPQMRVSWDNLKLKLFVIGEITLKTEISRLMRGLALLIAGGIPITSALDISASIVENRILSFEIQKFKDQIKNGANLSSAMKNSKFFPEFVTNIVAIGEETGTLARPLLRIADDYERELDRTLKALARLLEPAIILAVGLVVGFIVLSMLLPIFQINLIVR